MAGFVALVEAGTSPQVRDFDFQKLLEETARFKGFDLPNERVLGFGCTAAKLDGRSSLHRGITRDEHSGSWLIAAGTVVALEGSNDPQILLHELLLDYLENSTKALERYDGHFALAIYNGRDESLSIISDPMGIFAIYYAKIGMKVFVSSSALAIARMIGAKADEPTIQYFLRTGRPYGGKTLWQNVKRILPATIIKITIDKFVEQEYWKLSVDEKITRLPLNEALVLADEKICHTFYQALHREGRLWADLTGGYDSRMTTLYLDKLDIPFTAYCVGPDGHPDVEVSKMVSQEMGWDYLHMPLPDNWAEEQVFWCNSALGKGDGLLNVFDLAQTLKIGRERSQMHFASITGIGSDEWRVHQFGTNILLASAISKVDYDFILDSDDVNMARIPISAMSKDHSAMIREMLKENLAASLASYSSYNKVSQTDIAWHRYRHPIHVGAYTSANSGIIRSITPFCFKELVLFGLSINHQWRIKYDMRFMRSLMERENYRLANFPTEDGTPAVPIRFDTIRKFTPKIIHLADRLLQKTSKRIIGKSLSLKMQDYHPAYPLHGWLAARLRWAVSQNLFNPKQMLTAELYDQHGLAELVTDGLSGKYQHHEFLEWVITVEMALRATGASVE
ncbi:MAG: asparagine synthetase B family protein [Anaerolineaceae bacterium]